jgi:hypothetical protein
MRRSPIPNSSVTKSYTPPACSPFALQRFAYESKHGLSSSSIDTIVPIRPVWSDRRISDQLKGRNFALGETILSTSRKAVTIVFDFRRAHNARNWFYVRTLDVSYSCLFSLLVYFSVSFSYILRLPSARCICSFLGQWSQIDTPHVREGLMTRRGHLLGTRFRFYLVIRTSFTPFSPAPHTLIRRIIFSRTTFYFYLSWLIVEDIWNWPPSPWNHSTVELCLPHLHPPPEHI